ncbi:MAG: DUF433 domain-containing protein [Pacificimonas sp.]
MSLPGHDLINADPAVCHGRPVIAGTRMRVKDILDMLAGGTSAEEILDDFPYLNEDQIRAALRYAAKMSDHAIIHAAE